MEFEQVLDLSVRLFEAAGVGILVVGGLISFAGFARDLRQGDRRGAYRALRHNLGRTILLGLEILIVADIILTVPSTRRSRVRRRSDSSCWCGHS